MTLDRLSVFLGVVFFVGAVFAAALFCSCEGGWRLRWNPRKASRDQVLAKEKEAEAQRAENKET